MRKVCKVILVTLVPFFATLVSSYSYSFYSAKSMDETYEKIISNVDKLDINSKEKNIVDDLKKEFNNNDIIGTLKIDGTTIDTIVVQSNDNDYYLRRALDGSYSISGTVFMDYRNSFDDKKLLIYGHSYKNSLEGFSQLFLYENKEFYNENPYITLNLNGKTYKYLIFGVFSIYYNDNKYIHTKKDFKSDNDFLNHIKWIKENSLYDTNVEVLKSDRILTIQTCYYNPNNSYFIVNAKLIEEG